MKFNHKNILVVGASSGIGKEIAQLILSEGGTVYSASRHQPDVEVAAHFTFDASQPDTSFISQLPELIHGIVYCPGTINLKPFNRLTSSDFQSDFQVNVLGAISLLQALQLHLKKAKGASVVLFSTVAAKLGMGFHSSVAVSKGAVEGLSKSLAAEWALHQIRVNVVAPSLTDTPLASFLLNTPEKQETAHKRHPIGRFGSAKEVATVAAFLLSDEASWMTGQIVGVDGGLGSLR
ncbi:MAG: SDR family oxidoreductase [Spirosomataceae bacterium]